MPATTSAAKLENEGQPQQELSRWHDEELLGLGLGSDRDNETAGKTQTDTATATATKSASTSTAASVPALLAAYCAKLLGTDKQPPAMAALSEILATFVLGFAGILLVAITDWWFLSSITVDDYGIQMLTGAYAATAVLVFDAYKSPLAQPRNVIGGYLVSSTTGVTVRIVCENIGIPIWIAGALALSFSLVTMNLTKTVHPPGGACALISVIGSPMIKALGYGYVATSVGAALILFSVALIGNNLIPTRQYPLYWY